MEAIYIGFFFIALGILIKLYPHLIAGYNTLSQREKENAKANGLSTFMLISFSMMGLIMILGHFISQSMGFPSLSGNLNMFVILSGVVIMIIFTQKFKNPT